MFDDVGADDYVKPAGRELRLLQRALKYVDTELRPRILGPERGYFDALHVPAAGPSGVQEERDATPDVEQPITVPEALDSVELLLRTDRISRAILLARPVKCWIQDLACPLLLIKFRGGGIDLGNREDKPALAASVHRAEARLF